jgi:hypothetical protein
LGDVGSERWGDLEMERVRDVGSERCGEWETWRLGEKREIRREGDEEREMGGERILGLFLLSLTIKGQFCWAIKIKK